MSIKIYDKIIGIGYPTYFIADIGANHDGDISRAIELIHIAKEAGADAAKFQNFQASKIVSKFGFENIGGKVSHQSTWKKSVFDVYQDASVPMDWTKTLKEECEKIGIHYFSSPYDIESVNHLEGYNVCAYKIGSGDITWPEIIEYVAKLNRPLLIATGASSIEDVMNAMKIVQMHNNNVVLMQCNTNYTGSSDNFRYINLNVLKTYQDMYPQVVVGLSDHTLGHTTVLGAVSLGARVIEKHFTDDNSRVGPDHKFAMNPTSWRDMVNATRDLEFALGIPVKRVEDNELETVIVQRRCCRASMDIDTNTLIDQSMIDVLRPAPKDSIKPYDKGLIIGRRTNQFITKGDIFTFDKLV